MKLIKYIIKKTVNTLTKLNMILFSSVGISFFPKEIPFRINSAKY